MVSQMENDDDVDFDQMISQRASQRRTRQRGRIPLLRLRTREEDNSSQEDAPEEIESDRDDVEGGPHSAATQSDPLPSRHQQVNLFYASCVNFVNT